MKPDFATLAGVVLSVVGIGWGMALEGGSLAEILQPTAALIVLGGTAGATLLAQPLPAVWGAARQLLRLAFEPSADDSARIQSVSEFSETARRNGILAIEQRVEQLDDPFLQRLLRMAVDGSRIDEIREFGELRIERELADREAEAGVLEAAGGFAPTIGILGAVLGLIQVMKHLEEIEEVGKGIAVAFVATIYGVGLANLLLLPAAKKIVARAEADVVRRRMQLEGVLKLLQGANPRTIRTWMQAHLADPAESTEFSDSAWPRAALGERE